MNPHYVCPIVQKIKITHLKSGCENGYNRCNLLIINGFCGVGGIRTLVQTSNTQAFYMLILRLVFDRKQSTDTQFTTYLL